MVTAEKKDSQGLCFVGKISLPVFLQQKLEAKKGKVLEVSNSHFNKQVQASVEDSLENVEQLAQPFVLDNAETLEVAEHQGAHFYTIGQRKGLNIGGRPLPSFVIGIDTENNIVYSAQGEDHPLLNRKALFIRKEEVHWVNPMKALAIGETKEMKVRIRYRQPLQGATLVHKEDGMYIYFEKYQKGITPGQFAAFYENDELIGSGVILH